MTLKDLTAFLAPNLKLPYNTKVYEVPPPSRDDGLVLTALNATSVATQMAVLDGQCPTCSQPLTKIELDDHSRELVEAAKNRTLGEISLGSAYQEMLDDNVPHPHLEMFELYAMYYWVMGEEVADEAIARITESKRGSVPAPKARPASKSTHSTASGNPSGKTSTAPRSTRTTESPKKSPAKPASKPKAKA